MTLEPVSQLQVSFLLFENAFGDNIDKSVNCEKFEGTVFKTKNCGYSLADLGGREGRTPPPGRPNSFDFMQFSGKFGVFTPPLEGSRPPLGKILDPPLLLSVLFLLPPANEVWGKVICLQVCVCPQGGAWSRWGGAWWRPPCRTATAAGATHPTGMHSCQLFLFLLHPWHARPKRYQKNNRGFPEKKIAP